MRNNLSSKAMLVFASLALVACKGECGDGIIDGPSGSGDPLGNKDGIVELCDDGNISNNDGCDATCTSNEGFTGCQCEPTECFGDLFPGCS